LLINLIPAFLLLHDTTCVVVAVVHPAAAYSEAWLTARAKGLLPSTLQQLSRIPKAALEYAIVVVPQVLLLMSFAPAEPVFLLLFLLWGSLALKLWMKLAHSPASRQHMSHMLLHISQPRKR
jgi:hypothetical protein